MAAQWEYDENCAQLLWLSSVCDSETLVRPYQDLHDAASTLNNRFFQLYTHCGPRVGVNRAKVSGNGLVLKEEEVARVQKALEHISMRRIWSTRGRKLSLYRPGSIGALLARFPNLQDSLKVVADAWLSPTYAQGRTIFQNDETSLSAAIQLRMGAAEESEEAEFMDYFSFVHAVMERWLVGAAQGSFHVLDFDCIQDHVHQAAGGRAARHVAYARQLVAAQLVQLVRLDHNYSDIYISVCIPSYLNIHISPAESTAGASAGLAWIAERQGGAHPVHFQLPRAPCRASRRMAEWRASVYTLLILNRTARRPPSRNRIR